MAALLPRLVLAAAGLWALKRFGHGLGYLARYWTAEAVGDLLGRLGVATLASHEVLLLENGIAQVDLPCAGLKSWWTGLVFLIAANLLRGPAFGVGFGLVAAATTAAVIAGNATRVAVLVLLAEVADLRPLARAAHVPLGLFFFAAACGLGWLLLGLLRPERPAGLWRRRGEWLAAGLALVLAGWLAGRDATVATPPLPSLPFTRAATLALTPAEQRFFAAQPASVGKWQITPGMAESALGEVDLLLVAAGTWRAHHAPELCLAAAGFRVESLETLAPPGLFELRRLKLDGGRRQAFYFFQSPSATTARLERRLLSDLRRDQEPWVLASLVVDGELPLDSPALHRFLRDLHQAIDSSFDTERRAS